MSKKPLQMGGLNALLKNAGQLDKAVRENPQGVARELANTVATLPMAQIQRNEGQPREHFDDDKINELAESIKVHGIIQPITVRMLSDGSYQIISGERRFRASELAGKREIPAYIRLNIDDQAMMEMALIENIQREDLNPMEVANTYSRLKEEFKLTDEKLAERVGKQRSTVTNFLRLLDLSNDIQVALKNQTITTGHAKALAAAKDKPLQQQWLLEQCVKGQLSVRVTEALMRVWTESKNDTSLKNWFIGLVDAGEGSIHDVIRLKDAYNQAVPALKGLLDLVVATNNTGLRDFEATLINYKEKLKGGGESSPKLPAPRLPDNIRKIQDDFRAFFGMGDKKLILKRDESGKGELVIKFDNDDELNKLIDLIESRAEVA
jgi:ParB family transcriptional regulator, chromosome partitioning protein